MYGRNRNIQLTPDELLDSNVAPLTATPFLYQLFGMTLASNIQFSNKLVPGSGRPDVTFSYVMEAPTHEPWNRNAPLFGNSNGTDGALVLYRGADYDVMHFPDIVDFYLWPDQIVCHLLAPLSAHLVEIYLLGGVFSVWLERQGFPTLHASAVGVDGQAAVFLACNTGGKSSLSATMMQMGYPLLTDDLLPLDCTTGVSHGRPGYPQMRFWPEQADHFWGSHEALDIVFPGLTKRRLPVGNDGFGAFCDTSLPIACFYLPERYEPEPGAAEIDITEVSPSQALVELVRHTFVANLVEAMGIQRGRLRCLADVVCHVPMRHLMYPNGLEHLPAVGQRVLDNLSK